MNPNAIIKRKFQSPRYYIYTGNFSSNEFT